MENYNKIINNNLFKKTMSAINQKEKNRIYCCHSIEHCLDVARIAYILSLENTLNISKDIIYTTALLHDLGRAYNDSEHSKKSAEIAKQILEECNYPSQEKDQIIFAILNHRKNAESLNDLSDVICKADKLSRQCYSCKAQPSCYWKEEKRNQSIKY